MPFMPRKSTPKVKGGRVQKKNRAALTPNYWNTPQAEPAIDRRRPGAGQRHLLQKRDILNFIRILPDWEELSIGLNAIVLEANDAAGACHYPSGVVVISSWSRNLWQEQEPGFFGSHKAVYDKLGVQYEACEDEDGEYYQVKWTEAQAKAYQLLHILLHELGHHHDKMTTRAQKRGGRGEGYAETYALNYMDLIWERYRATFDPRGEHFPPPRQ